MWPCVWHINTSWGAVVSFLSEIGRVWVGENERGDWSLLAQGRNELSEVRNDWNKKENSPWHSEVLLKGPEPSEVALLLEGSVLRGIPPAHVCDQGWETSPMPCGFRVKLNCLGAVPQSYLEALTTTVQNALFLRWSWQEPVLQLRHWLSICIWMETKRLFFSLWLWIELCLLL